MVRELKRTSDARQRLVETAERLFYAEGVQAVGIDRIIAEAGVAKMTLYNHFSSKDDLILGVLQCREQKFNARFQAWVDKHCKNGKTRLQAFFAALKDWFDSEDFRGCMFINTRAELADSDHQACKFAAEHKTRFHGELKEAIRESVGDAAADQLAPSLALLVEGAIVSAVMSQSSTPAKTAADASQALVDNFTG